MLSGTCRADVDREDERLQDEVREVYVSPWTSKSYGSGAGDAGTLRCVEVRRLDRDRDAKRELMRCEKLVKLMLLFRDRDSAWKSL